MIRLCWERSSRWHSPSDSMFWQSLSSNARLSHYLGGLKLNPMAHLSLISKPSLSQLF